MTQIKKRSLKTRQEKLEYLNSLAYDVLIKQRENKFYLYIPEISLVASGDDLSLAYKDLNEQKQAFFNNILDCGDIDEVMLPHKVRPHDQTAYQLRLFAYKTLIICFLLGVTFIFGGVVIRDKAAGISGVSITRKVAKEVYEEISQFGDADSDVKKVRLIKLRRFLEAIRPIVDEFRSVFSAQAYKNRGNL